MSVQPILIKLDEVEYNTAIYAGYLINRMSLAENYRDRAQNPKATSVELNQLGQIGERVAAKALDLYWSSAARTIHKPDLSHNIEARATRASWYAVKVNKTDADDKRVVAIFIPPDHYKTGEYQVLGWCYAHEAKQPKWWKNPNNGSFAYFAPRTILRPLAELKQLIDQERHHDVT